MYLKIQAICNNNINNEAKTLCNLDGEGNMSSVSSVLIRGYLMKNIIEDFTVKECCIISCIILVIKNITFRFMTRCYRSNILPKYQTCE